MTGEAGTGAVAGSAVTVAFVGLGNMGTPMSARLLGAGYAVRGFDLSDDARSRLAEAGGTPSDSPRRPRGVPASRS